MRNENKITYYGNNDPEFYQITIRGKASSIGKCRNVIIYGYYKNQNEPLIFTRLKTGYMPTYWSLTFAFPFSREIDLNDFWISAKNSNDTLLTTTINFTIGNYD